MLISVIIITLNEEKNLKKTILAARESARFDSGKSIPVEILVSDGGSEDGTIEIAEKYADKVVIGPRERYKHLNVGAEAASGDILLFLHADTILPENGLLQLAYRLKKDPEIIGGAFKKYWNWPSNITLTGFIRAWNYFLTGFGNWGVRLCRLFPGDNTIFVRKDIFEELDGFSEMWILEGFDFCRKLKQYTKELEDWPRFRRNLRRIAYIRPAVLTSTRRFQKYGYFKVWFTWGLIYFLWRVINMPQFRLRMLFQKYNNTPEEGDKKLIRF